MKYSQAREHIKSGDIIAFTHKAWCSLYDIQVQAVRVFTKSEYSHVAQVWVFGDRVFVIEAVEPFVRIVPLSNILELGFYWLPSDTKMGAGELEYAISQVGIGAYSKIQAIAAQLDMLKIGADDKWECAELVIALRKMSGVNLGNKATPSAVVQKALENGSTLVFVEKD